MFFKKAEPPDLERHRFLQRVPISFSRVLKLWRGHPSSVLRRLFLRRNSVRPERPGHFFCAPRVVFHRLTTDAPAPFACAIRRSKRAHAQEDMGANALTDAVVDRTVKKVDAFECAENPTTSMR